MTGRVRSASPSFVFLPLFSRFRGALCVAFRTLIAMNIAIAGASGRMGRMLIETVLNDSGAKLSGALVRTGSPQLGQDAGAFLGKADGCRADATTSSRCSPNPTT